MSDETETGASPSYPRPTTQSIGGNNDSQSGVGNPRIHIDFGKHTNVVAMCAALCGLAAATAVYALLMQGERMAQQRTEFNDMKTQYKLMERRYMDFEAYALMQGWKVPSDDSFGPTGNLERMKPKR